MATLSGIQIPTTQTIQVDDPVELQVTEYDLEKDGKEGFNVAVTIPGIPPQSYEVIGILAQGEAVVRGAAGAFERVVVGEKVSGSGIPNNCTVKEVRSPEEIVLSAKATAAGESRLDITPQATGLVLFSVELPMTKMGNSLIVPIRVAEYDGSGAAPVVNEVRQVRIDVERFFKNAGVQRG